MAVHDGRGVRTTVFFKGCPLRCLWCHNPETHAYAPELMFHESKCIGCGECLSVCESGALCESGDDKKCKLCFRCADVCPVLARERCGEEWDAEHLAELLLSDRAFYEESSGGVTLSGGECLSQIDFAVELAATLFREGVSVDVDTSGYVPFSSFERIIPYTDEFLYDIKACDSELHRRLTGRDNALIIDNLKRLDGRSCRIEVRYPLVPGYNDGECRAIAELLLGLRHPPRIKVLGYHSLAGSKYRALGREYTFCAHDAGIDEVQAAVDLLRKMGLDAVNGMLDD